MFSNGPKIVTTGLSLLADASDQLSYPGSGTAWTDIITGTTASLSGSISFTTDFQGSLVTANSSSVIIFPSSTANFGTNTFTVEFAFRPTQINGQHWILSKNSGSFPNWGVYLTGSAGSGRLVAFFNISSTISCSLVSPTASITTGSNYIVDASLIPSTGVSRLYINSETVATGSANGTGSLSATAPLFFSNLNSESNLGTVNSVFNIKTYTPGLNPGLVRQNYNALGNRFGLSSKPWLLFKDLLLDIYPRAAAAYSLRQLSLNYAGSAIRVRRSLDNTETNIGFDNSGNLDTTALLNFTGTSVVDNGFVTTWYDQSGNANNATQATAANQPQIVSSGSVILENGKPSVQFDGVNDSMSFTRLQNIEGLFVLAYSTRTTNESTVVRDATNDDLRGLFMRKDPSVWNMQQIQAFPRSSIYRINSNNSFLMYLMANGTNSQYGLNGNVDLLVAETDKISASQIGAYHFQPQNYNLQGGVKELIFYFSDQSSNKTGIETNINDFYNIY